MPKFFKAFGRFGLEVGQALLMNFAVLAAMELINRLLSKMSRTTTAPTEGATP
jgi:hypothetical protein